MVTMVLIVLKYAIIVAFNKNFKILTSVREKKAVDDEC